ncbi:MAG: SPOR domain-containing protein, partial [Campylobacterales bacterium]|nr:SPOR domain-containing protein [Campylobacterales bacterium]
MRLWIVFLIGSVLLSATEQTYYRIVIGSYSKSENAEADKERFATIMQRDEGFVRLQQIQGIDFEIYNGSKYHTLSIKPFVSKTDAQDVLTLVHTIDKAPFIGRYTQNTNTPSAATHAVSISSHSSSESSESSESS